MEHTGQAAAQQILARPGYREVTAMDLALSIQLWRVANWATVAEAGRHFKLSRECIKELLSLLPSPS